MPRRIKRTTYRISCAGGPNGTYCLDTPTSAEAMRAAYIAVRHDGALSVEVRRVETGGWSS